jgi:hypothetical protein
MTNYRTGEVQTMKQIYEAEMREMSENNYELHKVKMQIAQIRIQRLQDIVYSFNARGVPHNDNLARLRLRIEDLEEDVRRERNILDNINYQCGAATRPVRKFGSTRRVRREIT